MKSKIKHLIKIIIGRDFRISPQIKLGTKWYGRKNLGFYVYDKNLNSNSIIYSFGIGEDISFDEELIKKFGCTIFGFDPTPKSVQFIKNKGSLSNFYFVPYGIYCYDGEIKFYLPPNSEHVSCTTSNVWKYKNSEEQTITVPVKKFTTILKEFGHSKIDVLKLDIEGSEYEVLDDILSSNIKIDQILIEFHHRFPSIKIKQTKIAINKLNNSGYLIAAISDQYEEFTFVNKNLIEN